MTDSTRDSKSSGTVDAAVFAIPRMSAGSVVSASRSWVGIQKYTTHRALALQSDIGPSVCLRTLRRDGGNHLDLPSWCRDVEHHPLRVREAPSHSERKRRGLHGRTVTRIELDSAHRSKVSLITVTMGAGSGDHGLRRLPPLAPRVPLPLYPYNMPAHTRTVFDVDTLKLAMDLPNCPGFKDSGGDLNYFESVLRLRDRHRPDWRVYIGPEHLTRQATALGGDGGVNGGANVSPKLFTDLFAAADGKEESTADRLQEQVLTFGGIYRLAEGESAVVRGLKAALSVVGVCSECSAEPWEPLDAKAMEEVKRILASHERL